jgi:hypothetical protein
MGTRHVVQWSAETRAGRWALSLAALAVGGTVAVAIAFSAGLDHGGSFADNWVASLAGVAILASAVASVVTGLLALTRRHEHSRLVVAATCASGLVTVLMLQQVAEGLGWLSG